MSPTRGGPQRIPRPADAREGESAPWAHLPDGQRVADLERLRTQLEARGPGEILGGNVDATRGLSAVLVALYVDDDEPHVVLTRRAAHMRSHTLEVSFPGGRADPDDRDPIHTALRESEEEIGLDPTLVEPLGMLDRFVTVGSETLVHPIVAMLREKPELTASPDEVEHILHVPLTELLLDEVYREERWVLRGVERPVMFFELVGDTVWGATAAMLRQLLALATGTDERLYRP